MARDSRAQTAGLGLLCAGAAIATAVAASSGSTPPAAATSTRSVAAPAPASSRKPNKVAKASAEPEKEGVEPAGDRFLRGSIDLRRAKLVGDEYRVPLGNNKHLVLTLDPDLQMTARKLLERARAHIAAIAVIAPDGRILALSGRRNLAPQRARAPSLALKVWAPAASIFKIITTTALLDSGVRPDTPVCYHGGVRSVRASNLRDIPKLDRRCNDLAYGFAKSQNAIFAKLVDRHLDSDDLERAAHSFGFGDVPQFALAMEASAADIPDTALARARMAAGFRHTAISPLAGALIANVIATGGLEVTPRIVSSVREDGEVRIIKSAPNKRVLNAKIAERVGRMMTGTVDKGTAYRGFHDRRGRRFLSGTKIAGKTGSLSKRIDSTRVMLSWFVGYAPADAPKVTVSVLLGNSPRWHLKASTAARILMQRALERR